MDSLDSFFMDLQIQRLQSSSISPPFSTFTLFPTLPTELRLKIISHALPVHTTLHLIADIVVADPEIGLYLSFKAAVPARGRGLGRSGIDSLVKRPALKATRDTRLLRVNKEFGGVYRERFPLSLPTGERGTGRIAYALSETILIQNFDALIRDKDFILAIQSSYRLQSFWNNLQILALPTTALIKPPQNGNFVARVMHSFGRLKEVKACMWEGFDDPERDASIWRELRRGVDMHLWELRRRLGALPRLDLEREDGEGGEEEGKKETLEGEVVSERQMEVVPRFVVVTSFGGPGGPLSI